MSSLLSSEWFESVRRRTDGLALSPDARCRIQFDADGARFGLVIEDGAVTRFSSGEVHEADLELRLARSDAERLLRRELRDDEAMQAATVIAQLDDGVYSGPPAPADLLGRPEFAGLPLIEEASLVVAYTFRRGPFGTVHHWFRFENGRPVEDGFGDFEAADVRIEVEYRAIPLLRSGEQTILDVLEGGTIEGGLGPITMLAGLLDAPEFRAADLASGRHSFALAALGELWAHELWISALEELAAETPPA